MRWRRLRVAAAGALALAGAVAPVVTAQPAAAKESTVVVLDNRFDASTLTITEGDTVSWANVGNRAHTVTSDEGGFDSGVMQPTTHWSHTFDVPGRYAYHCTFHGASGMTGLIVVKAASGYVPGSPTTTTTAAPTTTTTAPPPTTALVPLPERPTTTLPTTTSTSAAPTTAAASGDGTTPPRAAAPAPPKGGSGGGSGVGPSVGLATVVLAAAVLATISLRRREEAELY